MVCLSYTPCIDYLVGVGVHRKPCKMVE